MFDQCWSLTLQEGSSPGTGLASPAVNGRFRVGVGVGVGVDVNKTQSNR